MRIHIVKKGDTLWKIAKEYGISFEDLKRLNAHLANPDYIVPGMEIILPEKVHQGTPGHQTHQGTPSHPTHHGKEGVKKEVPKPTPPAPQPAPPPRPMPMPEPQMIPIPFPMPMPMPQPPMQWTHPPFEMNWNQQLVMPQMEQHVSPQIQIQPAPQPVPTPPPAPAPQPVPPPQPAPMPQPPIQIMPQMPQCPSCQPPPMMMPHCSSCHQPMPPQMIWPMPPMMPCPMPFPPHGMPCDMPMPMPAYELPGAGQFPESSSFDSVFNVQQTHNQPINQPCESPPPMMQNWQFDHCQCQPPCSPNAPWMPPQFFPGGMTPYRW